jgi:pimeloyl-ACP methyl ester carboxylesterase
MPLLILWGLDDVAIIPEQADESLEYCDQARLVKFDCTHWIQHEEPGQVNQMIEEFITQS